MHLHAVAARGHVDGSEFDRAEGWSGRAHLLLGHRRAETVAAPRGGQADPAGLRLDVPAILLELGLGLSPVPAARAVDVGQEALDDRAPRFCVDAAHHALVGALRAQRVQLSEGGAGLPHARRARVRTGPATCTREIVVELLLHWARPERHTDRRRRRRRRAACGGGGGVHEVVR